jgi:hypothetical protein
MKYVSGLIFTLTGCVLLVIKLATAASFSWWWVWGIMFAPLWILLGVLAILGAVLLAGIFVVAPFAGIWFIWQLIKEKNQYKRVHGDIENIKRIYANRK